MTWKQDGNSLLTFESSATSIKELQVDFELVLERLNKDGIISNQDVLLFIDATNGNIFLSGYDHNTNEPFDEAGIWIEVRNLWEEDDNAYNFDDIVVTAWKNVFKTPIGAITKRKFNVYYQTEVDDAQEFN